MAFKYKMESSQKELRYMVLSGLKTTVLIILTTYLFVSYYESLIRLQVSESLLDQSKMTRKINLRNTKKRKPKI